MEKKIYDFTVIGAGPVGLFGVFYAGMRQMSILLLDSLEKAGGQLSALYPEKYIYDMPGFPKIMAKDLVHQLWEQAQMGHPECHFNQKVTRVILPATPADPFEILCENGTRYHTKTMLLALGMGAFSPRKLEVAGLDPFLEKNIHYIVKPLDHYNDKDVLVIGGGDSAADWTKALGCENEHGIVRCNSVMMIHRTNKFSAHEITLTELSTSKKVQVQTHTELQSVREVTTNGVTKLEATLVQNLTKETQVHHFDEINICVGYVAKLDFVKELGLKMAGNAIDVNDKMETSIPRIYAAGDGCSHSAKLKLIATGVGEAAIAANFAKVAIDPSSKAFPGHSTSKFEKHAE